MAFAAEAEIFVGGELGKFVRVPELHDVRGAPEALGLTIARRWVHFIDGADHDLWLDAGESRMDRKLVEQIREQFAAALGAQNLVDRLEWDILGEFGLGIGIADATDLGPANDRQQIEVVE